MSENNKENSDAWNSALEALTEVIKGSEEIANKLHTGELENEVASKLLFNGVSLLKMCKQLLLAVQKQGTTGTN
jgi:exonuclease VII small subunit